MLKSVFVLRKFFSVIISMFLFMSSAVPAAYAPLDKDELKLSAVMLSDVHIEGNSQDHWTRFGETLAGAFSAKKTPDVIAFAGDQTMNSQWIEWFDFYGLLNRFNKGSKVVMAMGNHDFGNNADHDTYVELADRAISCLNGYTGSNVKNVYHTRTVKGYTFIVMGADDNAENLVQVISDEQVEWLEGELAKVAAEGKPAFVINHNLLYGKNGSRSRYSFNQTTNNDKIVAALENCGTDVFYFCGHSHYGVNSGTVNTEGRVTYINLPSAGTDPNHDADDACAAYGIGCDMEVYENTVELRFRNFAKGEWLEDHQYSVEIGK